MPRRVARMKIVLHRDDKAVTVRAGEAFDFTAEELKGLPKDAVRAPINEDVDTSLMTAEELEAHNEKVAKAQKDAEDAAKAEAQAKAKNKQTTPAGKTAGRGGNAGDL